MGRRTSAFAAAGRHAQDIDLIVMGTCARHGVDKLLLGSVAELVFRTSECPVLTLGPHVIRGVKVDGELRHILYATDWH